MTQEVHKVGDLAARGESCEALLWVGCAGAFDERYKKVMKALIKLLQLAKVRFAVLGEEEGCTGDPARRAGNEFLFQVRALTNIDVLDKHRVRKIITACPHCFNTLRNEYPALGGRYEVLHHADYLRALLKDGRIPLHPPDKNTSVVYHDSCYLGRVNGVYESPRDVLRAYSTSLVEMRRRRGRSLCCGAGGAQMFKESEKGRKEISAERAEEALDTGAKVVASACPFCLTMLTDGVKNRSEEVVVRDIAELLLARAAL